MGKRADEDNRDTKGSIKLRPSRSHSLSFHEGTPIKQGKDAHLGQRLCPPVAAHVVEEVQSP